MKRLNKGKQKRRCAAGRPKAAKACRKKTFAIDGPGDRMRVVFAAP